jgi:hypothetical protein
MTFRNLIITPVVILVRAPIMIIGFVLRHAGEALWNVGDRLPGWTR